MRLNCRKKQGFAKVVLFVLIVSIGYGAVINRLQVPFEDAFAAYAHSVANGAVNEAVSNYFEENPLPDFYTKSAAADGKLTSISANTPRINKFKVEIGEYIKCAITKNSQKEIKIALGAVQNNILLSAFGPKLKVKLFPSSVVKTSFREEFTDAGINQVRHSVYLDTTVSVTATSAAMRKSTNVLCTTLVSDTVIVGTVPNYYGSYSQKNRVTE